MKHLTIDRGDAFRAAWQGYSGPVRRVAGIYRDHKAHYFPEQNRVVVEASLSCEDMAREFRFMVEAKGKEDYCNQPGIINQGMIDDEFGEEADPKKGMPASEFCSELRGESRKLQAAFIRAHNDLEKTGLKEQLEETAIGMRKRRKRTFSEHDGDWDLDRKWDSEPFQTTKMEDSEFPFLEVCFPMNMLYGASKSDIANFGARCLALAELIEGIGYRVAIIGEDWNEGCIAGGLAHLGKEEAGWSVAGKPLNQHFHRFTIRDAGSYGNIQDFAVYTSAEFYRRAMFSLNRACITYVHAIPGHIGKAACNGYGRSLTHRPVPSLPGQLILDHDTVERLFSSGTEMAAQLFQERLRYTVGGGERLTQVS